MRPPNPDAPLTWADEIFGTRRAGGAYGQVIALRMLGQAAAAVGVP